MFNKRKTFSKPLRKLYKRLSVLPGTPKLSSAYKFPASRLPRRYLILLTYVSTLVLVSMVVGIFAMIAVLALLASQLPDPNRLLERSFELSTKLYDRNDSLMFEVFGEKNRTLTTLDQIPQSLINATLAAEDANFYQHQGYSLRGMARAFKNILFGEGLQSGSTLTQQVIKNTLLTSERTFTRKMKELILSLQLENRYSKDEIIQMYLNETPYGGQNYGVYSAAKAYFNKDPQELTLAESAYIAGLPQRPSYYSPYGATSEAGLERKDYVLYLMKERGWIGKDGKHYYLGETEYDEAKLQELNFETARIAFKAPHFIFYTKQVLADIFGEEAVEQGGLQVKTSLDLAVQALAEKIVYEEVEKAKSLNVYNGAMVVIDPKTGQILAMVGSKGYNLDPEPAGCASGFTGDQGCKFDPFVNVALSSRQPGSAIKPITYATMLSQGYTAAFPLLDVPTKFQGSAPDKPYEPENYDGTFRGPLSLRRSLGNSINLAAVKALKIVGIDNMIDMAEKMGITTFKDRSRYGLSLTLGGGEVRLLELTGAYSVIAAKGVYRPPSPIVEVKDSKGVVLYKAKEVAGAKVLSEGTTFLISDILSDDGARSDVFGFGSLLNIPGKHVAVKTGTTDDKRDNYAIGYTPSVVAGVWVGNSNNDKMDPTIASGITGATPIWNRFMREYLKDKLAEKFEAPEGASKMEVDSLTGMLPTEDYSKRTEWFMKGTEPTAKSDWYTRLKVCKIDGAIANEGCEKADETETNSYIKIRAELPEWQSAADAWVKEHYANDRKYFPPTITTNLEFNDDGDVTNKNEVYVKIVDFEDGDTVNPDFRLNVEISSYYDVKEARIYMDGEKAATDKSLPYGYNFSLPPEKIGEHVFEASVTDSRGNKSDDHITLKVAGWALQ